jgi:hypothetical protein
MMIDAKAENGRRLSETREAHVAGLSVHRSSVALRPFPRRRQTPPPSSEILIANARLEFRVSHSKQRPGPSSNRERIAIFQHDFSGPLPHHLEFLIGTFANAKFELTPCKRNTKQNSNRYKTAISGFVGCSREGHSPCLPPSLHPCLPASALTAVAATCRPRYNSGSHIEVNHL